MAGQSYTYTLNVQAEADTKALDNVVKQLITVAQLEKTIGNRKIDLDTRQADGNLKSLDSQIGNTTKGIKGLDGQDVNVNTKNGVAGLQKMEDEAGNAKQVIDSMDSNSIDNIGRSADQTANKLNKMARSAKSAGSSGNNLSSNFQNMSSGLSGNGMMSYLGLGSSYENTIGNAMTKEINAITSKNLNLDTDYIDKLTSKSMTRMNNLIPALNAGHSSTGKDMQKYVDTYVQVSDAVMALGYSEAEATSAMYDLTKGLNGAFASLDQYGISEASLMATGLWTGKEDDVEGYFKAVSKVLPETSKYMDSFQGDIIGLKKTMSSAGGQLGKEILPQLRPIIQTVTDFLTDVDEQGNKIPNTWAKGLMGAFMAFSAVQPAADALGTVADTFRTIKGAGTGAFSAIKSVIAGAKGLRDNISSKGLKGTIMDKIRGKGLDSGCEDVECCDDVCVDSAKELGKQKKKNGKTTQKNQKQQKKGALERVKGKLGFHNDMNEQKTTRKAAKKGFASDVKVPKQQKSHLGTELGNSKSFSKGGKTAGKGFLSGMGKSFKSGGSKLTKGLSGTLGKISGAVGGIGSSFMGLLGPIGAVIMIVTTLIGILDMLGIDWLTPLQDAFGGLGNTIMTELGNIGSQLMSTLGPAFNDLKNAFTDILNGLQPAINAIGEAFNALKPVLGMIGNAIINDVITRFQMLYTVGKAIWTAIGPVLTAIGQALYKVGHIIYDVLSKLNFGPAGDSASDFASTISSLAENVASFLQPVVDFIDNLDFSGVASTIQGIAGALSGLFSGTGEGLDFSGLGQGLSGISEVVGSIISTVISTMTSGILTLASGMFDIITQGITGIINSIGANIMGIINTVVMGITSIITTIGGNIMGIFSTVYAGIMGIITSLATGIATVIGSIGGAISGIVGSIGGAISGVIATVAGAITSVIGALSSGVVSVVNAIVAGFTQVAGVINGQLVAGVAALAAGFVTLTASVTAFIAVGTPGFVAMAASIVPLGAALMGVCAQLVAAAASVTLMSAGFITIVASVNMISASLGMAIVMMTMMGSAIATLQPVMSSVFGSFPGIVSSSVSACINLINGFAKKAVTIIGNMGKQMVSAYRANFKGIAAVTDAEMRGAYQSLSSWGDKMVAKMKQIAADMAAAYPDNIDVGSPGIIWRTTEAEMKGAFKSLASYEDPMVGTVSKIAQGMVSPFKGNVASNMFPAVSNVGNNHSGTSSSQSNVTVNNNVNIESVTIANGDDENAFIKKVIRAMNFETTRAGRTVGTTMYHS